MDVYDKLGLTGAIGSIDCTHIKWDRCPKEDQNSYTGKEGFPSVVFELVVDHNRGIMHCTRGFVGGWNDQSVSDKDPFVYGLRSGTLYKDIKYELVMDNGNIRKMRQVYLISDGGYSNEPIFINPYGSRWIPSEVYWSEWLESVRKDVECTFGSLKGRWRLLKNGVLIKTQQQIDDAFISCCMLHNILLRFNGLHEWEDVDWTTLEPDVISFFYDAIVLYYRQ